MDVAYKAVVLSLSHVVSVDELISILVAILIDLVILHKVLINDLILLPIGFRVIYFSMSLLPRILVEGWKAIIFNTNSNAWID